ncbi:unnamed protein product [Plutella xylostella]|uniref:(diamondback moth) hypothetical protein n=1 Tax=Plutella xylostella TaxID=51655 RepID=A0A8S4G1L1_PLUXY|nr:unnamed protein product [Plutella xylostella]
MEKMLSESESQGPNMVNLHLKNVVEGLVNGSLSQKLCRICLSPLDDQCENVFTKICKANKEYSIACVLDQVCNIKLLEADNFCVCSDCFISASSAYKFYLNCRRTEEILDFYVNELENNVQSLECVQLDDIGPVCITLPTISDGLNSFDYDLEGLSIDKSKDFEIYIENDECVATKQETHESEEEKNEDNMSESSFMNSIPENNDITEATADEQDNVDENDKDVIIILDEGKPKFYNTADDGTLIEIKKEQEDNYKSVFQEYVEQNGGTINVKKVRKKRSPMLYQKCSQCPVRYRFTTKLRDHMKTDHNIDLYICKICKFNTEDQSAYRTHLLMHTNVYICDTCGVSFKKRDTIIAHLQRHRTCNHFNRTDGAQICEVCGQILLSDTQQEHYDKAHEKKYTCYYCGRSYKGGGSFEAHIRKHEEHSANDQYPCDQCETVCKTRVALQNHIETLHKFATKPHKCAQCDKTFRTAELLSSHEKTHGTDFVCQTCNRSFVDARALLWHQRLHNNERPYPCGICPRAFVSANRRNCHALCAHTEPTRRCPLCPALFHLRSMVNSHIKKVHLNAHKRRNRSTTKYQDVYWKTEPVPIQELSISIQNDLLELQAGNKLTSTSS